MRRDRKGKRERKGETYLPILLLTNFHPSSILCLLPFSVSLWVSLTFLENVCWVWKDPREGRRRVVGGWLGGNSIQPIYSSHFQHLLLCFPPRPPAPWPLCPRVEPPEAESAPTPCFSLSLSLCPCHPTVGQKNNLSPSSLVSSLVHLLSQCVERGEKKEMLPRIEKGNEDCWEGQVAAWWACFGESSTQTSLLEYKPDRSETHAQLGRSSTPEICVSVIKSSSLSLFVVFLKSCLTIF